MRTQRRRIGYILLGAAISAGIFAIRRVWHMDTDPWGLRLWLFSLFALPISGYLIGARHLSPQESRPKPPPVNKKEVLAFIAIVALGAFLRVYQIDTIPPGIFVDETNAAGDALRILDGWRASPFGVGWFETPLGYVYYLAGLIHLFGPTYYTLKAASLIPAILTLVAFYPLARELFGPRVALVALAFLALNRWHMTMSRWGWNELAPPLFHVLSVYFLVRGSCTRVPGDFLLSGVLLGLGMYTYLASRLVALSVLAYLGYRMVIERGFTRRVWSGLLLFLLAYSLVFGPLVTTYVKNPFTFLNRSKQVSILNNMKAAYTPESAPPEPVQSILKHMGLPADISFAPLVESVRKHVRMFHLEGDYNPRHNIPGEPMLDPITGAFFLLGILYAIWRWRDHRYGLLLIWVGITLLGGILSLVNEAPQAYRTLGVVPAVCLLAGNMLVRVVEAAVSWAGRQKGVLREELHRQRLTAGVLTLIIAGAGWLNIQAFFGRWATDPRVWQAFSPMETAVAREVLARLDTHQVYLSPTLYWGSPLRFLTYRPAREGYGLNNPPFKPIQPVEDLPLTPDIGHNALFILEPLYMDLLDLFTAYYPHTQAELITGPRGEPLYVRVVVPPEDIQALGGLMALYEGEDGTVIQRRDGIVDFLWPEDFPDPLKGARVERITWIGSIYIPHTGDYDFRTEGELTLFVDGMPWEETRLLSKGLHAVEIVQEAPGKQGSERAAVYWRTSTEWERVPETAWFIVPPPQQGLLGTYYRGENWDGPILFQRVDRTLFMAWIDPEPTMGPFSVTWTGVLLAPKTGKYQFTIGADDGVRFWVDNHVVGESLIPDTVNQVQVELHLNAGQHPVRIDYFQRGGAKTITWRWRPPGERERVVSPAVLRPFSE